MNIDSGHLKSAAYWTETFRVRLLNEVHRYMLETGKNQTQLAAHLGVNKSRVSQILNGKENPTIEKVIEILLKIGRVPDFELLDQKTWEQRESEKKETEGPDEIGFFAEDEVEEEKVISPPMFQLEVNTGVSYKGRGFKQTQHVVVPARVLRNSPARIAAEVTPAPAREVEVRMISKGGARLTAIGTAKLIQ